MVLYRNLVTLGLLLHFYTQTLSYTASAIGNRHSGCDVEPAVCNVSTLDSMQVVACDGTGTGSLHLALHETPVPGDSEVLMRVACSGLNRIDLLMAKGALGKVPVLGMEAAGTITAVGAGLLRGFRIGDRVMALLSQGGHAQYVTVDERLLMPIPPSLSLEQAAAIPEQWLTAYQLLHLVGEVAAAASVLIHAGGSGVGTAAVQLAVAAGAVPYVTAGTDAKIHRAMTLGAVAGFNYKTEDWVAGVLRATQGRGVDIVLDCVGGSHAMGNMAVLALDARWVIYGLLGGKDAPGNKKGLLGTLLKKRASMRATTLRTRTLAYKAALVERFAADVLPLLADGRLDVVVDSTFPLSRVTDAYARLVGNLNIGKIVLSDFH